VAIGLTAGACPDAACGGRYIFLEWDTLATMPVREFYDEVWNEDAVGSTVKRI
jgi:hypothetical protein